MERYLCSGLFDGIGATQAKKLVDKFGTKVLSILENSPEMLEGIQGLGPSRRKKLQEALKKQKSHSELTTFFNDLGVDQETAIHIQHIYGEKTIEKVRTNPYAMIREIAGINFSKADSLATHLGITQSSHLRVRAGLLHCLNEASRKGSCALDERRLVAEAAKTLQVDSRVVEEGLAQSVIDADLSREVIDDEFLIYLPRLLDAEKSVAARVHAMCGTPSSLPSIQSDKAIKWYEDQEGVLLSDSQKEALRELFTRRLLIVSGGPGVGKTTLVKAALTILKAKKLRCLLAAPTGRAAKRLFEVTGEKAKTIHRLLEYDPSGDTFLRNKTAPLECDLLVLDEASMIDLLLMDSVFKALPRDAHLLLIGDVNQLPPIGPGNVFADLLQAPTVVTARLKDIFRQSSGSAITANAYRINSGNMPEEGGASSDFFFIPRTTISAIQTTLLTLVSQRLPTKFPHIRSTQLQVLSPMNRGPLGTLSLNSLLQDALNPLRTGETELNQSGRRLRPRDKVIQRENNYDRDVFNGDIGTILSINSAESEIIVEFDGREVAYDFKNLDEISLAYCITVHKAQGSEYPVIIVVAALEHRPLLQKNLLYTAVTRGKEFVVLLGEPEAVATAVNNARIPERKSGLRRRLQEAKLS